MKTKIKNQRRRRSPARLQGTDSILRKAILRNYGYDEPDSDDDEPVPVRLGDAGNIIRPGLGGSSENRRYVISQQRMRRLHAERNPIDPSGYTSSLDIVI